MHVLKVLLCIFLILECFVQFLNSLSLDDASEKEEVNGIDDEQ